MIQHPRQIDHPDVALDGDEGLRRVRAFRRLAERGLVHGDDEERALVLDIIDFLDRGAGGGLDAALGLAGPGWSGALIQYRLERRAADLRHIWRTCWPCKSANAAAVRIASHWRREAALRGRTGDAPLAEPVATLRRLIDAGHGPLRPRRIREILTGEVGGLHPVEVANSPNDLGGERIAP